MQLNRLIPILTIINDDLVKTTNFKNPSYVGDPLNAIRIFNDKFVDELILLDITSNYKVGPNYNLIADAASECFMPLTYGGKISNVKQAEKLFKIGVEKISINTLLHENPIIVKELVREFGSSSIVGSIDYINLNSQQYTFHKNKKIESRHLIDFIRTCNDFDLGEILLTCVNKEGTLNGPDFNSLKTINNELDIPLIYNGGISSNNDIKELMSFKISAIAASSFFVYYGPHRAVLIHYPTNI